MLRPGTPIYDFYRAFYETGEGRIVVLASPQINIRDGLAATQIGRCFPIPEFEHIVVEPGRLNIQPSENVIFVGSPPPYTSSRVEPLPVDEVMLGPRLERINQESCYRFVHVDDKIRAVENVVTGEMYVPEQSANRERDYGVIRRVSRPPSEFTVTLGGVHLLGTLGAAKVATSERYLAATWRAVSQIDGFDESRPLELLVQSTFEPRHDQGLYTLANIQAVPLAIVYNRRWFFDLIGDRWVDQLPWDIHVRVRGDGDGAARAVGPAQDEPPVPRLEMQADLTELDPTERALCKRLLARHAWESSSEGDLEHLLEWLTFETDRFRIELVHRVPLGDHLRIEEIPDGHSETRRTRKRLLIHLALCRILGTRFRCNEACIRRLFPEFGAGSTGDKLLTKFTSNLVGKMRDGGFRALLGTTRKKKDFVHIRHNRSDQTYELRLDRAALDLKLRV